MPSDDPAADQIVQAQPYRVLTRARVTEQSTLDNDLPRDDDVIDVVHRVTPPTDAAGELPPLERFFRKKPAEGAGCGKCILEVWHVLYRFRASWIHW